MCASQRGLVDAGTVRSKRSSASGWMSSSAPAIARVGPIVRAALLASASMPLAKRRACATPSENSTPPATGGSSEEALLVAVAAEMLTPCPQRLDDGHRHALACEEP